MLLSQGSRTRCFLMSQRERDGNEILCHVDVGITRNGQSSLNESCIKLLSHCMWGTLQHSVFCLGRSKIHWAPSILILKNQIFIF